MHKQFELLKLIADGKNHSHSALTHKLGISTLAVKNLLNLLKNYDLSIIDVTKDVCRLSQTIELLDRKYLLATFRPHTIKNLSALHIFSEIDSTNQYLLENAIPLAQGAEVVLAEYQTNGRGRYGKKWLSPLGSGINLSIQWHYSHPLEPFALQYLPLAVSLTAIQTLEKMGFMNIRLKWPNDLFFRNKKLGGVLIETKGKTESIYKVVVGLGLNVSLPSDFQKKVGQPCIDLASIKTPSPSRHYVCAELIDKIMLLLDTYPEIKNTDIINQSDFYSA